MGFEIVDLKSSPRASAFEMFKDSTMPTIILTSKFDVSPLVKLKKKGFSFNAMMMYCILRAGRQFDGCYYDIKGDDFIKYDSICVDMILEGKDKALYYIDIPYFESFSEFNEEYIKIRNYCYENCCNRKFIGRDHACLSTSAVVNREFESIVPGFFMDFCNPFFVWGKVQKNKFKSFVNISLRVHHANMDGKEVGEIFNQIQKEMNNLKYNIKSK